MYDPLNKYTTTANWQAHIKRGSLGGHDYAMPVGTRLPALFDGTVRRIFDNGTAGHTLVLTRADGVQLRYLHLSGFIARNGREVKQGDIIALSGGAKGAEGSGSSTGPHLHIDAVVKGVRKPYQDYLVPERTAAIPPGHFKVGSEGVNVRTEPNQTATVTSVLGPGMIVEAQGYVLGERVASLNGWLKLSERRYAWVGGFTNWNDMDILDRVDLPTTPPVTPPTAEQEAPNMPDSEHPNDAVTEPDFTPETLERESGKITGAIAPFLTARVRGIIYVAGSVGAIVADSVANVVGGTVGGVFDSIGAVFIGIVGAVAISHRQNV